MKKENLIGQRFGKLEVISDYESKGSATRFWCRCDCGNEGPAYSTHLKRGNTKSCGCSMVAKGSKHVQWTGSGEISGNRWASIRRTGSLARKRKCRKNLDFFITIDYAWSLFLVQDRKCVLTGLNLKFGQSNTEETTASLDRIDNSKGYIEGNVQWVHKDVNRMKNVFDQDYFIHICKLVAKEKK